MRDDQISTASLAGLTILIAGFDQKYARIAEELKRLNARVFILPAIAQESHSATFDEAIANLYGYDWLIFKSVPAVECFLRRFLQLGHQVSDLDALRVCAIGKTTLQQLEESHVHVDLCPEFASREIRKALEEYLGGSLRGINFLIPKAAITRDALSEILEEAGARVDQVAAFAARDDGEELVRLGALLAGGGIDALILSDRRGVQILADSFGTLDLPRVLVGTAVFFLDQSAAHAAAEFCLHGIITPTNTAVAAIVRAFTQQLIR